METTSFPNDLQSLCNELLLQARQQQLKPQRQQHQIHRPVAVPTTTLSSASGSTLHYHPQTTNLQPVTSQHDQYNVYQAHKLKIPMAIQGSIDNHHQLQLRLGTDATTAGSPYLTEQQQNSPSAAIMQLARKTAESSNLCSLTLLSPPGTNQPASSTSTTQPELSFRQSNLSATPSSHSYKSAFEFTSPTPSTPFSAAMRPMSPAVAATPHQLAAAVDALSLLSSSFNSSNNQQQFHHQRSLSNSSSTTTPYTAAGQAKKFNIDSILSAATAGVKSPTEALALLVEHINASSSMPDYNNINHQESMLFNRQQQRQTSCATLLSPHTLADSFPQQQQLQVFYGRADGGRSESNNNTSAAQQQMAATQAANAIVNAQQIGSSSYAATIGDLLMNSQQYLHSPVSDAIPQSSRLLPYTAGLYFPNNNNNNPASSAEQQLYVGNAALPSHSVPHQASMRFATRHHQSPDTHFASQSVSANDSSSTILRRRMQLESENNKHRNTNGSATIKDDDREEDFLVIDNDSDDENCLSNTDLIVDVKKQDGDDDEGNALAGKGKSRHRCHDCPKVYSTYSGLVKHREHHCAALHTHHHQCQFCQKEYNSLGALKMHVKTHTLPCKCKICGRAFSRPWLLQGHMRTHTGDKPFPCDECSRAFADRSNLRAHQQTHALLKRYKCLDCLKTFSRKSLLNKHRAGTACKQRLLKLHQQQQQQQQNLELPMSVVCKMDVA